MKKEACLVLLTLLVFREGLPSQKPAYSEPAKNFRPRLSVRLSGAFGLTALGDINKVLGSVNNNETFEYWRKNDPKYVVGEIKKLNVWTPDWEAEIRLDLTRRIGIGIATSGSFRRNGDSSLTYTYQGFPIGVQVHTYTYRTEIKAEMPIRLNIYYSLNPGAKRNVSFNAGIGYYSGKMAIFRNLEVVRPIGGLYAEKIDCQTGRRSSFGFHAGAGMEYALLKNLAFIIEVRGSFVRISRFSGVMDWENNYGLKFTTNADLYYFSMFDDRIGARYSGLEVWEQPEDLSFRDTADMRKARLDLGGVSLRVGMRLDLF